MVNTSPYLIPTLEIEVETIVNRSRFLCAIKHCVSNEEVKAFIASVRAKYPDASHHCYAFISARPENSQAYGFSDDGEPSGTAGRPMLAVLQGSEIGEICAVVTRYFGGVKLGTGGLQRAYGLSVREAIEALQTELKVPTDIVTLECDYQQVRDIEHILASVDGVIINQQFTANVIIEASIPIPQIDDFCQRVFDNTAGRVVVNKPE